MKRFLILLLCVSWSIVGYGQVRMYIKCIHVGYNVADKQVTYGMRISTNFETPRLKLDLVIENNTADTVRFNTGNAFLPGEIKYEFDGKPVTFKNAGWLNSENELPELYIKIPPDEAYKFSSSFHLEPAENFTTENYLQNFWSIIPTLSVTIIQDKPEPLVLKSEPVNWQNLSICNDKQRK